MGIKTSNASASKTYVRIKEKRLAWEGQFTHFEQMLSVFAPSGGVEKDNWPEMR